VSVRTTGERVSVIAAFDSSGSLPMLTAIRRAWIWQALLSKHAQRLPDIREELIHHIVVAGDISWNRLHFRIGIACSEPCAQG
jgi:hypothetical protein